MKKTKNVFLILLSMITIYSCDEDYTQADASFKYVSFENSSVSTGVEPNGMTTIEIPIYTSNITRNDRTVNIELNLDETTANSSSYTFPNTATVIGGTNKGSFNVEISDTNLDCFNDLSLELFSDEELSNGPPITITYFQIPSSSCSSEVSGSLDFAFDDWASEISWEILDVLGGTVASGPDTTWANGTVSASIPITLCSGRCYSLVVNDSYGDGIGSGSFSLTIDGQEYANGDGNFGSSISIDYQID